MPEWLFCVIMIPLGTAYIGAVYLKIEHLDNGNDSIWERRIRARSVRIR